MKRIYVSVMDTKNYVFTFSLCFCSMFVFADFSLPLVFKKSNFERENYETRVEQNSGIGTESGANFSFHSLECGASLLASQLAAFDVASSSSSKEEEKKINFGRENPYASLCDQHHMVLEQKFILKLK